MFAVIKYPWPVPTAHVILEGANRAVSGDASNDRAEAERLVQWTSREWLRFSWFRLRLVMRAIKIEDWVAIGLQSWVP